MRLKQYLNESYTAEEVVEIIKKDCPRSYIVQTKGEFFYRGTKDSINDIKKFKSRTDRIPKDTPPELHNMLDSLFKRYLGWHARSEGTFVNGKKDNISGYGISFMFFPIGKYDFVWSPSIEDLYSKIEQNYMLEEPEYLFISDYDYDYEYNEESGNGKYEYEGILYNNINDIEDTKNITGNNIENDAVWIPNMTFEEYREKSIDDYENNRDTYLHDLIKTYSKTNLNKAMKSGHEVMFRCKEYYMVDAKFSKILRKELW